MNDNKLQKRPPTSMKEKSQYVLAFGIIASMLLVAGFPTFVVFFFGIFAYFLWKSFSSGSRNEAREIFEFYLAANNILRDDDRRWFGFEMQEVITRGEQIVQNMSSAPPLVHFTLGALYNKTGDHGAAINRLSHVLENETSNEANYIYPTPELRNYVRVLRKIEREPADAPLTAAAVRALERARRNRGPAILEDSRKRIKDESRRKREEAADRQALPTPSRHLPKVRRSVTDDVIEVLNTTEEPNIQPESQNGDEGRPQRERRDDPFVNRKPISEVLHDIYDKNIQ